MRRDAMFAVTTMSLVSLGLVLAATDAVAQQKSIKDQLVGTWTVVSWDQVRADGSKVQRFAEIRRASMCLMRTAGFL